MKHIKLYEDFKHDTVFYRNTVFPWIKDLLDKGSASPAEGKKFVSFSMEETSGDNDAFGDIRIDFDAGMLRRQGAVEVIYTEEFFKDNPDICMYVTGYASKNEYLKWARTGDNTWDEYIHTFENEEEVILKKVKMQPGLIKKITVWDADERSDIPDIHALMKKHKIKVEIPWLNEPSGIKRVLHIPKNI